MECFGVAEKVVGVRGREFVKGGEVGVDGFAEKVVREFGEEGFWISEKFFREGIVVPGGRKEVCERIFVKRFGEGVIFEGVSVKESVKKVSFEKAAVRRFAESSFVKGAGTEEVEVKGRDLREAVIQGVDFKNEFIIGVKC